MLAPGMSLKLKSNGGLKRSPCYARMFRAKSKDHEGTLCKGHDRIASKVTVRGAMTNLVAAKWRADEQPHLSRPFNCYVIKS